MEDTATNLVTNSLALINGSSLVWALAQDKHQLCRELEAASCLAAESSGLVPFSTLERFYFNATVSNAYDVANYDDTGGLSSFSDLIGKLFFLSVPRNKVRLVEARLLKEHAAAVLSSSQGMAARTSLRLCADPKDALTSQGARFPGSVFSEESFQEIQRMLKGAEYLEAIQEVQPFTPKSFSVTGSSGGSAGGSLKRIIADSREADLSFNYFKNAGKASHVGFTPLLTAWAEFGGNIEDVSKNCVSGFLFDRECDTGLNGGTCHRHHG